MRSVLIVHAALAPAVLLLPCGVQASPAEPARFTAMLERPLFSPTRRPPPQASPPTASLPIAPSAPPPTPPPDVALSGVITGGGGGVALLRRPQDQVPVRVALGGQVDGWTVAEIRPRAVVLRREARSITIDLPTASR